MFKTWLYCFIKGNKKQLLMWAGSNNATLNVYMTKTIISYHIIVTINKTEHILFL